MDLIVFILMSLFIILCSLNFIFLKNKVIIMKYKVNLKPKIDT